MPSREPELYKDKIEVSLDGRQIFYLFFGGAVIVGLVFVVGVMVGRRVESRGHLDRADTQTASDPLAALDRLERADNLSFHGALTGGEPASDVEKAIGELEKRRSAAAGAEARLGKPEPKADVKADARPPVKPEAKVEAKPEAKVEAKADAKSERSEARSEARAAQLDSKPDAVTRSDADKPKADKHDEHKSKKHDDSAANEARSDAKSERAETKRSDVKSDKPVTKPDAKTEGKSDDRREAREGKADTAEARAAAKADARSGSEPKPSSEGRIRFTLQLSSFQDRSEAEAFLSAMKAAGFQAYLTEADVGGKGTFYRVRLGSFRSLESASDAKAEYDKTAKKPAQVMRL